MAELIDDMKKLAQRAKAIGDSLKTEEATKNALVMPFVQALGYNVFDPTVVVPEYTSDHGIKKGEKVDYAIMSDGAVQILVECKVFGTNLDNVGASQLYRYFSVTDAKIAILTNGHEYRFFTDLDEQNKMDKKPFFVFGLHDIQQAHVKELEKFKSECFVIDDILSSATDLKYRALVVKEITKEMEAPSDDFVKFLAKRTYPGNYTQQVKEWFSRIVDEAVRATVREMVNKRLSSALEANSVATADSAPSGLDEGTENDKKDASGIVTTQEEVDAFNIIRAIVREVTSVNRVSMRDNKSYCAILLDDNNRKTICRLYLNSKNTWRIGIFIDKVEQKHQISCLEDMFGFSDAIKGVVSYYDSQ